MMKRPLLPLAAVFAAIASFCAAPELRADPADPAAAERLLTEAQGLITIPIITPVGGNDPVGDGAWGPVINWTPHIPVSGAVLPNGKLMTFASNERTAFPGGPEFTYAAVWDPATGNFVECNNPRHDMFCGGISMLPDGRVVVNGGRTTTVLSSIFDWNNNTWSALPNMNDPRWYNPNITLPDGNVFTVSGSGGSNTAERWDISSGWRRLSGVGWSSVTSEPGYINIWHPFLALAPNGKLFHFGPTQTMHWVDPSGTGTLTNSGQFVPGTHYPKEGAWAMYDNGKILVAGGGANSSPSPNDSTTGTSTTAAYTVDLTGATPVITPVAPMLYARQFANSVILPDGEVMVIGGNAGVKFSDAASIMTPEVWNPRTGQWHSLASQSVPRNYHSLAFLLPDGRVWSGGGGLGGGDHRDAQIFTPPALYAPGNVLATRPVIAQAPSQIGIGSVFNIQATAGLQKFTFIRLGSGTHSYNSDQRYLELPYTETSPGIYRLTAHSNINVMNPGYWMLFALDGNSVHSVAKIIRVDPTNSVSINSPGNQTSLVNVALTLQTIASGPLGTALTYSATNLPTGLTINPSTGLIGGSPTVAGVFNSTIAVSGNGKSASQAFTWTMVPPTVSKSYSTFTGTSDWTLNGNAALATPALRLTPAATGQYGSAFLTTSVPVTANTSFSARFVFRDGGGSGADGMTFTVQGNSASALGGAGGGLGYETIDKSLAIEVDEFQGGTDPNNNHVGVLTNGSVTNHLATSIPAFTLADNNSHTLWVDYDGTTNTLRVYLDQAATTTKPGSPIITLTNIDLPALLGSTAWFGFTGATGGATNNHDVLAFDLTVNAFAPPTAPSITSISNRTSLVGTADSLQVQATDANADLLTYSATGLPPNMTISSSTGLITGTPTAAGTYNVTVNVNDGTFPNVSTSFTWTVNAPLALNPLSGPPAGATSASTFSVQSSGGLNPVYQWNFGDGTPVTSWSSSSSASHSFANPGRYLITVTAKDDSGRIVTSSFYQAVFAPPTARKPTTSSGIVYEPRSSGNARIWVVNPDTDTVSVFDAVTRTKLAETAVGKNPRCVAIAPDGSAWVTNVNSATISVLNSSTFAVSQTITLQRGSRPFGLAFDPVGTAAWVTMETSGLVLKLNPSNGAILQSINAGQDVRHLSVNADGSRVYVSRFITPKLPGEETANVTTAGQGGQVLVIDTTTNAISQTILLQHSEALDTTISGRGIPNYLAAPVITPDGLFAWVASKQDNIKRGVLRDGQQLTHESAMRPIASRINLTTQAEVYASRVDFDNAGLPSATCIDPSGAYAFVALEGSRTVAVVDIWNHVEIVRFNTGRAPEGLTMSPDGRTLFVQNFMDRTVTVHDVSAIISGGVQPPTLLGTVSTVATEKLPAQILVGKQLFYDSKDNRLALQEYISCAGCHNEGGHDGRIWDFTGFGEGLRNTITLRGHGNHGALHWSGNFDEVQDFENQIRTLALGTGLIANGTPNSPMGAPNAGRSADLDALAAYVKSLTITDDSPNRTTASTLPAAALAGRTLFKSKNCASCHGGAAFTDSAVGVFHDVGTIKASSGKRLNGPLTGFDSPSLRGLWNTSPYLHDGSAASVEASIAAHTTISTTPTERTSLAAYLAQIDDVITTAPVSMTPTLSTSSASVTAPFVVTATLSSAASSFPLSAITLTNGVASNVQGGGTTYTFTVTPGSAGNVTVAINAAALTDADGDPALASNVLTVSYAGYPLTYSGFVSRYNITNGPTGNSDNDLLPNLLEFALGGDPGNGATPRMPRMQGSASASDFVIQRPSGITDVTYAVEGSSSLQSNSWTTLSATPTATSLGNGLEQLTWANINAAAAFTTRGFVRLKATLTSTGDVATSPPVGFYQLAAPKGNSAWVAGLVGEPVFAGNIASVATDTQSRTVLTLTGGGLTASALTNHYAEVITADTRQGVIADIAANTANTVTLTAANTAFTAGTRIMIRPHATLGTLFPGGGGLASLTDSVSVIDATATKKLYYWNASAARWIDALGTNSNAIVIRPGYGFIIQASNARTVTFGADGVISWPKASPTQVKLVSGKNNWVGPLSPLAGNTTLSATGFRSGLRPLNDSLNIYKSDGTFKRVGTYLWSGSSYINGLGANSDSLALPVGSAHIMSVGVAATVKLENILPYTGP
jgi:YVTN family beta-propeller protein